MKSIYLIITLALFSISCTQSVIETDGVSTLESRIAVPTNPDDIPDTVRYPLGTCSVIKSDVNTFSAELHPFQKYSNSTPIVDQMLLFVHTVPVGVLNGAEYIQFFKESDELGVAVTNPNPVEFKFVDSYNNELNTFSPITELSKSSLETAIEESGIGEFYKNNYNIDFTPAHLINRYDILLTGLDLKYESVRTAFYSGNTPTATSQLATLLPGFAANPNTYQTLGKSNYLEMLHPMYDRRNSGLTDLQFKQEIESKCSN